MADEPEDKKSETDDKKEPATGSKSDDIKAMEAALKKANKEAEAARLKLKEIEDKDKSEVDKLRDERDSAQKEASDAKLALVRMEVASDKGLTPAQAKRLVGATKEEFEADADEFLESIKPSDDKGKPGTKPREDLKGGGDPTEEPEEMDPRKLAEQVPRY